jgi:hypothetical protein
MKNEQDPDPNQNGTDPKHLATCLGVLALSFIKAPCHCVLPGVNESAYVSIFSASFKLIASDALDFFLLLRMCIGTLLKRENLMGVNRNIILHVV